MYTDSKSKDCPKCKVKGWCEIHPYPLLAKLNLFSKQNIKNEFFGATPNIFVSRIGYPKLNVGFLAPQDIKESEIYDAPKKWADQNFDNYTVLGLRKELVNSRFETHVKNASRFLELAQETAMSYKPVDIEISLKNPEKGIHLSPFTAPLGPRADLQKIRITENPKVPGIVEKVVGDVDYKAAGAVNDIYKKLNDSYFATKVFSVGLLGVKTERKLVPTRWSITAVDDIIGKNLIDPLKYEDRLPCHAFFGGYLGNYFLILFIDAPWSYELIEMMVGTEVVTTDYESYGGRKEYVQQTAGGYYATRLSILEYLSKQKKQATVLVFRFITDEYKIPMGVWVVREAVKKALQTQPIFFDSLDLMLNYTVALAKRKFNYQLSPIIRKSKIISQERSQTKLSNFIKI